MKKLFLLRHAQAAKKEDGGDFDRPLTDQGQREAKDIAEFLLKKSWIPDMVISSPAVRTYQTGGIIFHTTTPKKQERIFKSTKELYNVPAKDILEIINQVEPEIESLMVISHNPGITDILNEFNLSFNNPTLHAKAMNYDVTCKLVVLQFEGNKWSAIQNENCILRCVYGPFGIISSENEN